MRLTRNSTPDGKCKYAIVRLDKLREIQARTPNMSSADPGDADVAAWKALRTLERLHLVEYGEPGSEEECFVIKLKDKNATVALDAYALEALNTDPELASDVHELAERANVHPSRKLPD